MFCINILQSKLFFFFFLMNCSNHLMRFKHRREIYVPVSFQVWTLHLWSRAASREKDATDSQSTHASSSLYIGEAWYSLRMPTRITPWHSSVAGLGRTRVVERDHRTKWIMLLWMGCRAFGVLIQVKTWPWSVGILGHAIVSLLSVLVTFSSRESWMPDCP